MMSEQFQLKKKDSVLQFRFVKSTINKLKIVMLYFSSI